MSLSSFGVFGYIQVCPRGRRVHSGSMGSFGCSLGVVGSIQLPRVYSGTLRLVRFPQVRPGCRRVHTRLLSSFACSLVFIRFRWVHLGAPCVSSGSFGVIRVRPGGHRVV